MNGLEQTWHWYPLKAFGITHWLTAINVSTIIATWIAMGVLFLVMLIAKYFLQYQPTNKPQPGLSGQGLSGPDLSGHAYAAHICKTYIKGFITLVEQTAGTFMYRYFAFIGSLFTFILFCNWIALLPFVEEPTKDLNTTLALGIVAFLYIQKEIIQAHGGIHYLKEYFLPVQIFFPLNIILGLALFPLKILGEVASVISLSFRLFGNIFGGATIIEIFHNMLANSLVANAFATISGVHILLTIFFVLFEGGLQAFVFAILTLTNITMAISLEGES